MTALAIALLIPWVGGVALLVVDGRRARARWLAAAALVATLVALGAVAVDVLTHGPITVTTGNWPVGVGITLRADALGVTFALLSVATLTAAVVHEALAPFGEREFPALVALLAAGLNGAFLTGDIFNFYVFFELALAASYVLATHGREPRVLGAGLVFAAVNVLGTLVFLLSVASIYRVTGTLDMALIADGMKPAGPNAAILIAVGFFVAFSVKLGLFPFHFWLPTVYAGSRPAVAAVLSGAVANIGGDGLLRFGGGLFPEQLQLAAGALVVLGAASIVYGAVLATSRGDTAETLAYSAIGQVGYVLVALGVGGPVGFTAAVLYTLVNALNKGLLFLATELRGRLVAAAFVIGALSVAGVPPAVGFLGKLELFRTAVTAGDVVLVVLLLVGSALSLLYMFQTYQRTFWRESRPAGETATALPGRLIVAALGVVVLALGLWPEPLLALGARAAGRRT